MPEPGSVSIMIGAMLIAVPATLTAEPPAPQGGAVAGVGAGGVDAPDRDDTQDVEPAEPDDLHIPGYDGDPPGSSLTLEIAPEIVSHNPLGIGSQTTDALNLTLTFATRHRLARDLELEFDAGAAKSIDSDDGSSSNLAASVELRTRPGAAGVTAFANYTIRRDYEDFFDRGVGTDHTVTAGVRFGRSLGPAEIGLELAPRFVESSNPLDDHRALNLWGETVIPVFADGIILIVDASVERRWYANADPLLLAKRRDWRLATFTGLDFAGAVNRGARRPFVRDLGVGVEWLEVSSNFDDAERSNLSLLPAVTLGISF